MSNTPSLLSHGGWRRRFVLFAAAAVFAGLSRTAAAEAARHDFDIPGGNASDTLKVFAAQADEQMAYPPEAVAGVITNPVKGQFTPREALERMTAGTELEVVQDEPTGALSVRRSAGPNAAGAAKAVTTAPENPKAGDQTVVLNPFEVSTDPDNSYAAINSNSITAFNVALGDLPISADLFDQTFMNDVGATTVEAMIQTYSAGAGLDALATGSEASTNQPGDQNANSFARLRGHMAPNEERDSLLTVGTFGSAGSTGVGSTNNFDVERVEVINGPQALLYDNVGAGGVINIVSKEARLDTPAFGSALFRIDQWGSKSGELDYGVGNDDFALRVATINGTYDSRRIDIGSELDGVYVQGAARVGNTIVRLSLEQTTDWQTTPVYLNLVSTSGDPLFKYNGDSLNYLLATGQAGAIDNGNLNWSNVNSYVGQWAADTVVDDYAIMSAESEWTKWLSTQVSAAYNQFHDDRPGDNSNESIYTPLASSNPIPGNWTLGETSAIPVTEGDRINRNKAARFDAVLTNELFGGKAHSQTIVGWDYSLHDQQQRAYGYFLADSNFNPVVNPASTANVGRTAMSKSVAAWTVDDGSVLYALFPVTDKVTYAGSNYVLAPTDPLVPSLVTPANPEGASIVGGQAGITSHYVNDGYYAANFSKWLDDKLDTLVGIRLEHNYWWSQRPTYSPPSIITYHDENHMPVSFNIGADYHLLPWLAPYVSVSRSNLVPPTDNVTPIATNLPMVSGLAEEAGIKVATADARLSGSVALYHDDETNSEVQMPSSLELDINPTGLNGVYGGKVQTGFAADTSTSGLEATLTATPTKNWRNRLSAAITLGNYDSTTIFSQLYNDQFHENSAGDVTYADGTIVYVPATFNSKQLTVTSTTAGAVPLTTALLSTPTSQYYAEPLPVSGAMTSTSNGAKVLDTVDPVHGAILTGALGLPISDYQLLPSVAGITLPGTISPAVTGQRTVGYPRFSVNFTSVYVFPSGWPKGIEVGGTATASWDTALYYYYPNGLGNSVPGSTPQSLFSNPTLYRIDLILGYTHKFGRFSYTSQINIYNVFNRYDVLVYPDELTGWTSAPNIGANFDQQPRSYQWTNTIQF